MSESNTMYQMYKQMILGYKLGSDGTGLFEHAVKCWLDTDPDNPFPEDSEAFECFFRMKSYYKVWKLAGVDRKISMRRMLSAAKELCALKVKNPYKYDRKAAEEEKAALKEAAVKSQEEYIKTVQEAERIKEERAEEIRHITEELNKIDIERNEHIDDVKAAVNKVEINNNTVPERKHYVFNVVDSEKNKTADTTEEKPQKKKKTWFERLIRKQGD